MSAPRDVDELGRAELAVLVREYLLAGQLMDRAGMPHVIAAHGRDVMGEVAIDEWMGASPIYTRRTQQLLGFVGDDVETIFKGMQFDVGAPPEFMDFRYRVIDAHHGEFWLDHCGALMDVEPMGDDYVTTMCHTIEDPTFDATALGDQPRARVRPLHRPPRRPRDRQPHCSWTVQIDPGATPLPEPEPVARIAATRAAALEVPTIVPVVDDDGWDDYAAPLDPDVRTEQFSQAALLGLAHEVAVQTHLLAMSFLDAVARRDTADTADAAREVGRAQFTGIAGLTAERLRLAFGWDTSFASVAQVLAVHPAFQPRTYVDLRVEHDPAASTMTILLHPCAATDEANLSWIGLLVDGHVDPLDALVRGVDPHLRCEPVAPSGGALRAWAVVHEPTAAPEAREVALTRFSTGADFRFSEVPVQLGAAAGGPSPGRR